MHTNFCMLLAEDTIWMSTPACQSRRWPHTHKGTPLIWKGEGPPNKGEKASQWPGVPSTRASVLRVHHTADHILPHTLNIKIWNAAERYHRGAMLPRSQSAFANPSFLLKRPRCVYVAGTLAANLNQTKHLIITVYFWTIGRSTVLLQKLNMNMIPQLRKKGLWYFHLLFFFFFWNIWC